MSIDSNLIHVRRLDHTIVYYQIFEGHTNIPSKTSFRQDDPYTGRIEARRLSPPRSAIILKQHVADLESISSARIVALHLSLDDEQAARNDTVIRRVTGSPGTSVEAPLAIIVMKESLIPVPSVYENDDIVRPDFLIFRHTTDEAIE